MESFPPTKVTNFGIELLKEGVEPNITYVSPDGDMTFYLNGGLAPWPGVTEGVVLAEGMRGMHAPFSHLDHKGARQDGATWADTVYDPAEIDMQVVCTAQTPEGLRKVIRKWFAAWDPERRGTLSWVTPDSGEWWCHPRLFRAPQDQMARTMARSKEQLFNWTIRNDDAFWRSHDSVSTFQFQYKTAVDTFNRNDAGTLGPHWKQTYTGPGAGVCESDNSGTIAPGRAVWSANDPDTFFTGRRSVTIGPYKDFSTANDGQEVNIVVNNTPEYTVGTGAANHIWGRMGRHSNGTWNGNGVRASVGWGFTKISVFVDYIETVLRLELGHLPPFLGDKFTLVCTNGNRNFQLKRNGFTIMNVTDTGNISVMNSAHRGVGFGLQAGGAILTQATPAEVRKIDVTSQSMLDTFNYTTLDGLGANWPLRYEGTGGGYVRANGDHALWMDTAPGRKVVNRWLGANETQTVTVYGSPSTWTLSFNGTPTSTIIHPATPAAVRTALENLAAINPGDVAVTGPNGGPYQVTFQGALAKQDFPDMVGQVLSGGTSPYVTVATTSDGFNQHTVGDNQIISVTLGEMFQFPFPDSSYIDVWARMNDNDANPTGIRLRIGPTSIRLSRFNNGVETTMRTRGLLIPTFWGQTWTLICGTATNSRHFRVQREGFTVLDFKEQGTGSALGASYRGCGFGMESGDGTFAQRIPPSILEWSMGDNASLPQSGHLSVTNFGDQPGYPDLVVYGPGTFKFGDGPGVDATVEFGPLLEGQVALIKTHPGMRAVHDITAEEVEQDLPASTQFLKRLISYAFNNNVPPLMNWFQSLFGIAPPQGNMYALLKGRFSRPVPPRPVAGLPETSKIAVTIEGGNAFSKVVAALTPLRRWPE